MSGKKATTTAPDADATTKSKKRKLDTADAEEETAPGGSESAGKKSPSKVTVEILTHVKPVYESREVSAAVAKKISNANVALVMAINKHLQAHADKPAAQEGMTAVIETMIKDVL